MSTELETWTCNTDKQPEPAGDVHAGQVVTGAIILTMGIVMLLDRTASRSAATSGTRFPDSF